MHADGDGDVTANGLVVAGLGKVSNYDGTGKKTKKNNNRLSHLFRMGQDNSVAVIMEAWESECPLF